MTINELPLRESPFYRGVIEDFAAAGVPEDLLAQISPNELDYPRDVGRPGIWANEGPFSYATAVGKFDLRAWFARAPEAWGPSCTADEIEQFARAGDALRYTGEGATVLWAVEATWPEGWRDYPRIALSVEGVAYLGRYLTDDEIGTVADLLPPETFRLRKGDRRYEEVAMRTELNRYGATVHGLHLAFYFL